MASIIAGHGRDGDDDGIIGVAPQAKILSIRVIPDMNDPGYQTYDNEPERRSRTSSPTGSRQAVRDHAQVISMSIGYSAPSGAVRAALQYAYEHGTVLVASAGNSGDNDEQHTRAGAHGWAPVSFPAEYPGVLSVGAVNIDGSRRRSPAATCRSRSPRRARGSPPRAGTASTTPSTAPARPARWWRAWPR